MNNQTCPRCDGKGQEFITGFICSSTVGGYVEDHPMKCDFCKGSGEVPEGQIKQARIAKHFRQHRIELRMTQREAAQLFGMSFSEYNDLEHGRFGF